MLNGCRQHIGTSSHMQHASGIRVPSETEHNRELLYGLFAGIFHVKHTHTDSHLGSSCSVQTADSLQTERNRFPVHGKFTCHSRAERQRSAVPGFPLPNNTLNASSTPRYLITWCFQEWLEHTHTSTHTWRSARARLLLPGYSRTELKLVCVCVCVSPPLPRAESFKPQNKRGPDGGESSILKCF